MAKKRTVTQFNLFGEPEIQVVKKNRPKKTEAQKEAEREERKAKKKAEQDKEFERKWAERGVVQGSLFPTDECIRKTVSKVIRETVQRIEKENLNASYSVH